MKIRKYIIPALSAVLVAAVFFGSLFARPREAHKQSYAMGSPVNITVYGERDGARLAQGAADKITELDSKYLSHTNPNSLTCRLNDARVINADSRYTDYLKKCLELSGCCEEFTLLSGGLKRLWKTEQGGRVPSAGEIADALLSTDEKLLGIDSDGVSLGGEALLDLGALGKGTACQAAVDFLKDSGAENAVCTVGGSVGVTGSPDGDEKFTVGVRNPFGSTNEYLGTLSVTDCFISTSGDYEKYFELDGKRYCHIFNAATGAPVQNELTSVTVIADDGTVSDFLSTAVFILGKDKGFRLAEDFGAQAIAVYKDKSVAVTDGLSDTFILTDSSFKLI